ncbi:hypothetical protein BC834DRAFT_854155 [Gloeopeniophorella convolvens]|nr:hypothetical protein BC834DRAFT_854155 [Gloeopeniophorella convolvens]
MSIPANVVSMSSGHTAPAGNSPSPSVTRSTLKFILDMPSRWLARLRWLDELLDREAEASHSMSLSLNQGTDESAHLVRMESPSPSAFPHYPGPWSFFASGYAVSLFAMALLLNRIQNIVVPGRRPPLHHGRSDTGPRSRWAVLRLILPSIFPIDLSSTYSRTILRLPTLYYILRSLVLWSVLFLQASDRFPSSLWKPLQMLDEWASRQEMDDICWSTFLSVCGVLCVGALTRGLEGVGSSNASPFNLFGYSFMLHFYSSPLTHLVKPEGLPSRPDVNVVFTILMPLFQLTMIHLIGIKQSWSNQRLIPTTICSVLTLIHFHSVLWSSPLSYPLLNYMSCIFDTLLLIVILVAFLLNILTQLLLEGSINRPFVGHAASLMPKWDEDFSIVLLRLGIASLEATSVAGLGNEVGSVSLAEYVQSSKPQVQYGEVEMDRAGVVSLTHAVDGSSRQRQRKEGFVNEVRHVKVGSPNRDPIVDPTWFMEFKRFGYTAARFGVGCGRVAWRVLRGQPPFPQSNISPSGNTHHSDVQPRRSTSEPEIEGHQDVYDRFLAGEALSDDDEDDFALPSSPAPDSSDDDAMESDVSGEEVDTVALYSDLSVTASSSATAPLLLAHMTDTSSLPLTRRRYGSLVSGQQDSTNQEQSTWDAFVTSKRNKATPQDLLSNESRRNCVICTVEERQIICWPCRCLALCDDCRENLASRLSASKHTCPCCRQPVEGFSRIYIP